MQPTNQEYTFTNVILIESTFKRVPVINFSSPDYKNDINLELEVQKQENQLSVFVTLFLTAGTTESPDVEAQVKMLGVFLKNEEINQIDMDTFGKINAPAIIFPFIREHIASVSSKAGIPTILLPPINFVKLAQGDE